MTFRTVTDVLIEAERDKLKEENTRLRAELDHIKEVEFPSRVEKVVEGWRGKCERLQAELDAARRTAEYWKAEHLAGNTELAETQSFLHLTQVEVERLRAEIATVKEVEFPRKMEAVSNAWRNKLAAARDEITRLTAERDRALDRIAEMAAELDTPYAWHHLHHGLRYERGDGDGWWPLHMIVKPGE